MKGFEFNIFLDMQRKAYFERTKKRPLADIMGEILARAILNYRAKTPFLLMSANRSFERIKSNDVIQIPLQQD